MIQDIAQADTEMAKMFTSIWEGAGYPVIVPNVDAELPDDPIWAQWQVSYNGGGQRSFGPKGRRKFEKIGAVIVTVFTPFGEGVKLARGPVQLALSAYEGKATPGGVTFQNCRVETEGQGTLEGGDRNWWATVVVAEFSYFYLR